MDNRSDILDDVLFLPDLVMKGDLESRQLLEDNSDIHLGAASHTKMYIRKFQVNEFFNQLQDLLAVGRLPRKIWAFIDAVDHDINWVLPRQAQHLRHTFLKRANTGLSSAAT